MARKMIQSRRATTSSGLRKKTIWERSELFCGRRAPNEERAQPGARANSALRAEWLILNVNQKMNRLRIAFWMFAISVAVNVLVVWASLMWSPSRHHVQPVDPGTGAFPKDIVGPTGEPGWWFIDSGFGQMSAVLSEGRGNEQQFAYFYGEHTPAYYRGGWPLYSMQSVVRFQQANDGTYLSEWTLSWSEIIHRGIQTTALPAWLHVIPRRRLPVIPLWAGFIVDTFFYFGVMLSTALLLQKIRSRRPNQALQPAPSSVTPRVVARVAPTGVVVDI